MASQATLSVRVLLVLAAVAAAWVALPVAAADGTADCKLLDVEGGELDTSEKTCQECSMACATNSNCHTLVFDGREFKKATTSSCEPIPFWEEFYSVESTQAWISAAQSDPEAYFSTWMDAYSKIYDDTEAEDRRKVWEKNLERIYAANDALGAGLAPNELADRRMEEIEQTRGGLPPEAPQLLGASDSPSGEDGSTDNEEGDDVGSALNRGSRKLREAWGSAGSGRPAVRAAAGSVGTTLMRQGARLLAEVDSVNASSAPLPKSFDWREQGMPIKVRNQGECNSCYAFATSSHMEALWWMATGSSVDLSENDIQQCCDLPTCWVGNSGNCANPLHCGPCNNGWPHIAMSWVVGNGQATEQVSAYNPVAYIPWDRALPGDLSQCKRRSGVLELGKVVEFDDKLDVTFGPLTEEQVMKLVVQRPIVVAMDYLDDNFKFLGPAHTVAVPAVPRSAINHAVLLLGYGEHEKGGPYWLIQNSWGAQWGDGGLARLARTKDDPWKVLQYASAAYLKSSSPLAQAPAPQPSASAPKAPPPSARSPKKDEPAAAATPAPGPNDAPGPSPSLDDLLSLFAPAPGPVDSSRAPAPAPGPAGELWIPQPSPKRPSPSLLPSSLSPLPASPKPASPKPASPGLLSPATPSPLVTLPPSPKVLPALPVVPALPSPAKGRGAMMGGTGGSGTDAGVAPEGGVGGAVLNSSPEGNVLDQDGVGAISPAGEAVQPTVSQAPAPVSSVPA